MRVTEAVGVALFRASQLLIHLEDVGNRPAFLSALLDMQVEDGVYGLVHRGVVYRHLTAEVDSLALGNPDALHVRDIREFLATLTRCESHGLRVNHQHAGIRCNGQQSLRYLTQRATLIGNSLQHGARATRTLGDVKEPLSSLSPRTSDVLLRHTRSERLIYPQLGQLPVALGLVDLPCPEVFFYHLACSLTAFHPHGRFTHGVLS